MNGYHLIISGIILGVDGLSIPMVILNGLLCFIGVFVSWNISKAVKGYFALYLTS